MSADVLLVDDEVETLIAVGALLRRLGHSVDTASSLDDARSAIASEAYRLVITDLRLSGPDTEEGSEVLRYARETQSDTPVIVMTGYGSPAAMTKLFELGAAFYFEKPVQPRVLAEAVEALL